MSLILKGIDLPSDCYMVELVCYRTNPEQKYGFGGYVQNVPLKNIVQIPKGHGDIKDVSEFIKAVDHAHDNVWNRDDWLDENMRGLLRDTKKRIEKLPTILEAEE